MALSGAVLGATTDAGAATRAAKKGSESAAKTVAAAYTATAAKNTGKFTLTEQATAAVTRKKQQTVEYLGRGVFDVTKFSSRTTVTTAKAPSSSSTASSSTASSSTASSSTASSSTASSATGSEGTGTKGSAAEIIQDGAKAYVAISGGTTAKLAKDKPWMALDLNEVSEAEAGKELTQIAAVSAASPVLALVDLSVAPVSATSLGTSKVGGAKTTEYRFVASLRKVMSHVKATYGVKDGEAIEQQATTLGENTLTVHAWISATGLVRKLQEDVPIALQSDGGIHGSADKALATFTFSHFGVSAKISAPPSANVTNVTARVLHHAEHVAK